MVTIPGRVTGMRVVRGFKPRTSSKALPESRIHTSEPSIPTGPPDDRPLLRHALPGEEANRRRQVGPGIHSERQPTRSLKFLL
ncbi:hypothetical protein CA12_23010 [Alienimonas californiensis]|uniref:Uncharacterized protein n=1 Tax=Alienimonas californiensis TaxID=2527989 RepID=A0A517P9Z9_9PLAN|nr:hypothetical protein CA12_23010 [Alienimonas californiensis]